MNTTQKLILAYREYMRITRKWINLPDKEAEKQYGAILKKIAELETKVIEEETINE